MGMEGFYTRDKANEGQRLPLRTPDGQATDHWLQVRNVWSDAFQSAEEASMREMQERIMAMGEKPEDGAVAAAKRDCTNRLLASLVAAWSFDEECTPDNVAAFLANAPQIAEQINRFSADGKRFFAQESPAASMKPASGSEAKSD